MDNKKLHKMIHQAINKAVNVEIRSEIPFNYDQIEALDRLNEYCVNQVLNDTEVLFDPRKIGYKANQEMLTALTAMCLAQSLINPARKTGESKEFFQENITICVPESGVKLLCFGKINPDNVYQAVYPEIIDDWMIYRNKEGLGIQSLIDEKTNLAGLDNYQRGGNPLYEFARFHRKYTEKERKKEERARESAQEAFRNEMVKTLAARITEQQLLEGKNPMEMLELLFAPEKNRQQIKQISQKSREIDPQIENNIMKMLEYSNSRDDNTHSR